MIICPRCGKLNSPQAHLCEGCAQPLAPVAAPRPGAMVPPPPPATARPPGAPSSSTYTPGAPWPAPPAAFGVGSLASPDGIGMQGSLVGDFEQCWVCGARTPVKKRQHHCPRCKVPYGSVVNPNDFTCSTPMAFTGTPVVLERAGLAVARHAAPVIRCRGVNVGAALFSLFWALRHRCWGWAAACFVNLCFWALAAIMLPFVTDSGEGGAAGNSTLLSISVALILLSSAFWIIKTNYMGWYGNTLAMAEYPDEATMRRAQRGWSLWGGITGTIFLLLLLSEVVWVFAH